MFTLDTDSYREWSKYRYLFKQLEIGSNKDLLQEGEVAKNAYIVENGSLRVWINNDGQAIAIQDFKKGEIVAVFESLFYSQPSLFNITTLEPTTLKCISKRSLKFMMNDSIVIRQEIEKLMINRLLFYKKLFLDTLKKGKFYN